MFDTQLAFLASTRITDTDYKLPENEPYVKVRDGIQNSINAMLERTFEPVTITTFDGKKLYGRYYHVADDAPLQIFSMDIKAVPF